MQIIRLTLTYKNINEVIQLIKQTFLEFVAPDYDEAGIKNFFKFAEDVDFLNSLSFMRLYIMIKLLVYLP